MTKETQAELRLRLTTLVTLAGVPGAEIIDAEPRSFKFRDMPTGHAACAVVFPLGPSGGVSPPPLTTAQQLALSVLVGEPDRVVLSALCDLLIEQGHEYAVAVAEKARRDERRRIVDTIREWAGSAEEVGDMEESQMLLDLAEVVND